MAALLSAAIDAGFDSGASAAVKLLLATDGPADATTAERRKAAAECAGYSVSYFSRHVEPRLLEEVALVLSDMERTVDVDSRTADAVNQLLMSVSGLADEDLLRQAVNCGLAPLLRLAHYPEEIRYDFSYRCHVVATSLGHRAAYRVLGDYGSERAVQEEESLVVMCRTLDSLRTWFDVPNVLGAEFTPFAVEDWYQAAPEMAARLLLDGRHANLVSRVAKADALVFTFDTSQAVGTRAHVEIRNRYLHDRAFKEVTIRLRNHFSFGNFDAEVTIDDPDIHDLTVYDYIAGVDENDIRLYGRAGSGTEGRVARDPVGGHALVRAGPNVVIWPGSGVHFSWRDRPLP